MKRNYSRNFILTRGVPYDPSLNYDLKITIKWFALTLQHLVV